MSDTRTFREKVEAHALAMQRFLTADRQFDETPSEHTHDMRDDALRDLTKATRALVTLDPNGGA